MLSAVLLTQTLGSPPVLPPQPSFEDRLSHAEITTNDSSAEIVAYDANDAPIGVIATWIDEEGDIWIASEYDDGFGDIEIIGDRPRMESTLSKQTLGTRARAIGDLLNDQVYPEKKASWWKCGRWVAGTVVACYAARPIACVGGSVQTACSCVPKLVKEFEHLSCPWD